MLALRAAAALCCTILLLLESATSSPSSPTRSYLGQQVAPLTPGAASSTTEKLYVLVREEEQGAALINLADHVRSRNSNVSCHNARNGVLGDARHLLSLAADGKIRNATGDYVRLDREQLCNESKPTAAHCWLNFTAMYCDQWFELAVDVADVNDWQPVFPQAEVTVEFSEADEPPTWKRLPLAIDRDGPSFAVRRYSLKKANSSDPFCIAADRKTPSLNQNQVQRCSNDVIWHPNSTKLNLLINGRLDRETRAEYRLELVAEDGSPHKAHMNITVVVNDVNDHTPKFSQPSYTVNANELSVDSLHDVLLLQVAATDADAGENAELAYWLDWALPDDVNNYIEVNEMGEVRARGSIMDYEKQPSFTFRVLASDNRNGGQSISRTGTAEVTVNLVDVNDNAPSIKVDAFGIETLNDQMMLLSVSENGPEQQFVAKITVSDADSGENGRLSCSVTPESSTANRNSFQIVRADYSSRIVEYQIKTGRTFDREQANEYLIEVRCHDAGNPPQSSHVRLAVRVSDTNDNAPRFNALYYDMVVAEDAQPEQSIGSFEVTDADDGLNGQLQFRVDPSVSSLFRVEGNRLVLAGQLDRESRENYSFAVYVSDQGEPPLTASAMIRLHVTDVNDNAPQLNSTLHIDVPENIRSESLPHLIYTIDVRDVDAPGTPNSNVTFMLLDHGPFILDKNGNLFLNEELNRELNPTYQFQLLAHDNGNPPLTSTCTVSVTVTDANDEAPIFIYPLNNRTVVRPPPSLDIPIVTFEARDRDGPGDNSRVRYALTSPDDDLFYVNETSGQLFLRRHTSSGLVRQLKLSAVDGGRPPMSSSIVHTIELVGVPQMPSIFDEDNLVNSNSAPSETKDRTDAIYIICAIVIGISACLAIFIIILILIRSRREHRVHRSRADEETGKKRISGRSAASNRKPNSKRTTPTGRSRPQSRTDNVNSVQHSRVFSTADYRLPNRSLMSKDADPETPVESLLPMASSPLPIDYDLENAGLSTQLRSGLLPGGGLMLSGPGSIAATPQFAPSFPPPCAASGPPKLNSFCLDCDACMQTLKANMQTPSMNRTDHYQFSRPSSSATVKRQNEVAQLTYQPNCDRRATSTTSRRIDTASSNRYESHETGSNPSVDSYESGTEWDGVKDAELPTAESSANEQAESLRLLNAAPAAASECNNNTMFRIISGMMSNTSGSSSSTAQRSRSKALANVGAQPIAVHEVTPLVFDLQPHLGTGPFETVTMPPQINHGTSQLNNNKQFKNISNFEHSFV